MRWLVAAPIQPWGGWRFTKRRWQSESYIARSKLGVVAPVTVIPTNLVLCQRNSQMLSESCDESSADNYCIYSSGKSVISSKNLLHFQIRLPETHDKMTDSKIEKPRNRLSPFQNIESQSFSTH
jgi:hypothetical protein